MSGKPAARLGDPTACPIPGHGSNPIAAGSPNVLFDGLPAARMGDASACGGALASAVIPTVLINGMPATTVGTVGSHGNTVTAGSGTVIIGMSGGGAGFTAPSAMTVAAVFDEQFRIIDGEGKPLANVPFHIKDQSGNIYQGFSDGAGQTQRIRTAAKETLEITTGVAALEKWDSA
ncbi:MAG: PAAR domain-containing protein [Pseudomonas sp.]|uniref:PAAR domain-containing protein n=1 Tax=Pseudomonas sp. TaxID=306 RepID=UPI00299D1B07|nr:PAAR domain-containing protein [Pseudomonas sp.]MDX1725030.1 PAAR domain-containing protein [Pseudomonas sp.]